MMRGRLGTFAGAVVVAVVLAGLGAQPAAADGGHTRTSQHSYLALGDSVPFGYSPLVDPRDPANFVGYPQDAAPLVKLAVTNASCPGQTSSGFISLAGTDNGCVPFRAAFPLHAAYTGTQLRFAVSFLRSHPGTRLVSLTLGANDLFVCQNTTADQCASPAELAAVLKVYQRNLTTILSAIRKVYHGRLVAVTYYSTDYRNPLITGSIAALNGVTTRVVRRYHGVTADGFTAFAAAAAGSGGDTCAAGLLIKLPGGGCDVHPTVAGAQLLAATLAAAVRRPGCDDDRDAVLDRTGQVAAS